VLSDLVLSDGPIAFGVAGWLACTAAVLADAGRGSTHSLRAVPALVASWLSFAYLSGGF
jgi:hypothetical protein